MEFSLCLFQIVSGSIQIRLSLIPCSGNVIAFKPGDDLALFLPCSLLPQREI